jgi:hypothetical protein
MSETSAITNLHERGHALKSEMRELLDHADAEERSLTAEEEQKFDRIAGDVDKVQANEGLMAEAAASKGWLTAYGHDVSDRPTDYGCTPADLDGG